MTEREDLEEVAGYGKGCLTMVESDVAIWALAEIDRLAAALADANRLIDELTDEARDRDAVPAEGDA